MTVVWNFRSCLLMTSVTGALRICKHGCFGQQRQILPNFESPRVPSGLEPYQVVRASHCETQWTREAHPWLVASETRRIVFNRHT